MARSPPNMGHHGGANMGNFGQQQQKAPPSSFSMMNIVPVYTLLVVGYAVYIWFKGNFFHILLYTMLYDPKWVIFQI